MKLETYASDTRAGRVWGIRDVQTHRPICECVQESDARLIVRSVNKFGSAPVVAGEASTDTAQERSEIKTSLPALPRPSGATWEPIETLDRNVWRNRSILVYTPANFCSYMAALGADDKWYIFGAGGWELRYEPSHWAPPLLPPVPVPCGEKK